jgi:4-hydroxybenzoate polyprenyltransferase
VDFREAVLMSILIAIAIVLALFWLLGFIFSIGGGLIHVLLIVAVIVLLYEFLVNRRTL